LLGTSPSHSMDGERLRQSLSSSGREKIFAKA